MIESTEPSTNNLKGYINFLACLYSLNLRQKHSQMKKLLPLRSSLSFNTSVICYVASLVVLDGTVVSMND